MKKLLLITALGLSCGEVEKKDPVEIQTKMLKDLRTDLISKIKVKDGWVGRDCDGLLWNSQALIAGVDVDLYQAEYEAGVWHRRPEPACYIEGRDQQESGSTTSNDMQTGLMLALWKNIDLDGLNRLYDYGNSRDWVMGEPYPEAIFRVVLRSNGRYLIANMIKKLGGKRHTKDLIMPNIYLPVKKDFERHLMGLGIYTSGEVDGKINTPMHKRLKENVAAEPNDALFNAFLGLYDDQKYLERAIELISAPEYDIPSYVRGDENYQYIHMAFAITIMLEGIK